MKNTIKKMDKKNVDYKLKKFVVAVIIISYLLAIILYPYLPYKISSHCNAQGNVDNYLPKFWGLFLMPFILTITTVLFYTIPKIDPLRKNIEKFRDHYEYFILILAIFMFYIYLLTVMWNLGYRYNFTQLIIPALALLLMYTGFFLKKAKRNWFIGIRTPWTLSNDIVWQKTHELAGNLYTASGIIALFGMFSTKYMVEFIMVPILISVVLVFLYSYFIWKNLKIKK